MTTDSSTEAAGEHEQALINAAADELHRIADDADREAAEQLAELGEWGHSPADILAEPDVDTSGCSNPWHRMSGLYSRRACPECPPVERPVETVELPTGCQHPGKLGRIACGWGHCTACGSALRTANGNTPELDAQGRFMYAENGDLSASIVETVQLPGGEGDDAAEVDVPATRAPELNERQAMTLRYYNDPTGETLRPLRALRGQMTGTHQALERRGLVEPSDAPPYTVLTALGRQVLADYDRTDPQT